MAADPPQPQPDAGAEAREAELLRINAELAAEVRSLSAARIAAPRSAAGTAARRVSRLVAERDRLAAELEASRAEVERLRGRDEELSRQVQDQARHLGALQHEVNRLRGGPAGILRRIRARLLRRPPPAR